MIVHCTCLSGAVSYEVHLPFDRFVNCHCSRCRKATGSAHAANAIVQPRAFRWTRGAAGVVRTICRRRGANIHWKSRAPWAGVPTEIQTSD
jgi:hypothetical protein